jgi:hypothetical protein
MKKGKLLAVALIALLMAGGLVLASCRVGCDGPGNCNVKDGKGTGCTNFDVKYSFSLTSGATYTYTGCAAMKAAAENKSSGNCDC